MKSKILKKNPKVQCLALEFIEFVARTYPDLFLPQFEGSQVMNAMVRLVGIPSVPPVVLSASLPVE